MAIRISRKLTFIQVGPGLDLEVLEVPDRANMGRSVVTFTLAHTDGTRLEVTKHSLKFAAQAVAEWGSE